MYFDLSGIKHPATSINSPQVTGYLNRQLVGLRESFDKDSIC